MWPRLAHCPHFLVPASSSHHWSWFGLYSWACLRVPVFQHLCRTCVLIHFEYFKPTYVFIQLQSKFSYSFFFINKGFSSFTSPSIRPLLQTIIIYSTVKFIHFKSIKHAFIKQQHLYSKLPFHSHSWVHRVIYCFPYNSVRPAYVRVPNITIPWILYYPGEHSQTRSCLLSPALDNSYFTL